MMPYANRPALIGLGLAAGATQALAGVAMYLGGVYFASWSMLVSLLVLELCIVVGTRWYKARHLNGVITYGQAAGAGITISLLTGVVYAIYNLVSIAFFYPNFLDEMARAGLPAGVSPGQESVRAGLTAPMIAMGNLIRLSIFGSILSLITAMFLKSPGKS
jgi:hypothetical protein